MEDAALNQQIHNQATPDGQPSIAAHGINPTRIDF